MNFGLIGAGQVGRVRQQALRRASGCQLAAIADADPARARSLAGSAQAAICKDYKELLRREDVDAVVISTPPDSHEEIAVAALEAGKHVLCEKPLAPNPEACRRMLSAAGKANRTLSAGFCQRYFPAIQFVKETVTSGAIGELSYVRAFTGHAGLSEFSQPWVHDKQVVGGGALMDNGIHMIDLVRHILGDITEVYGTASANVWKFEGSEDNGFAMLHTADGKVAQLQASWTEWRGYRFFIEAYGDCGMARASYAPMFSMAVHLDELGAMRRRRYSLYPRVYVREALQGWTSTVRVAFTEELQDFARLASGQSTATIADGIAGLRAVEIAHAVYTSSETRQPVTLAPL